MIFTEHDCLLPGPATSHPHPWHTPHEWQLGGTHLRWAEDSHRAQWWAGEWMQVVRIDGLCPSIYPEDNQCDHCGTIGRYRWYFHESKLCCGLCIRSNANLAVLYTHSGSRRHRVATCATCHVSLSLHVGQPAPSVFYAGKKAHCRQCRQGGDVTVGRWTPLLHDLPAWQPLALDVRDDYLLVNTDPHHVDFQQLAIALHAREGDRRRLSLWRLRDTQWEGVVEEGTTTLEDMAIGRGMQMDIAI
jgi:hypothetical protein